MLSSKKGKVRPTGKSKGSASGSALKKPKRPVFDKDAPILNESLFREALVAALRADFDGAAPFRHTYCADVLDPDFARALREEILGGEFFVKKNDLYDFLQTDDMRLVKSGARAALRESIYSARFRDWIGAVTGIETTEVIDMTAAQYNAGSYLLCHDDDLSERRIAYILYLVPEDWSEEDGGGLDLFSSTLASGTPLPDTVVKTLTPRFNSMALFDVSPIAFHQVAEVMASAAAKGPRLSISGWYHGTPIARPPPPLLRAPAFVPLRREDPRADRARENVGPMGLDGSKRAGSAGAASLKQSKKAKRKAKSKSSSSPSSSFSSTAEDDRVGAGDEDDGEDGDGEDGDGEDEDGEDDAADAGRGKRKGHNRGGGGSKSSTSHRPESMAHVVQRLSPWVQPAYLAESTILELRRMLRRQGSLELDRFLRPDRYRAVLRAMGVQQWTLVGPPNLRHYHVAATAGGGEFTDAEAQTAMQRAGVGAVDADARSDSMPLRLTAPGEVLEFSAEDGHGMAGVITGPRSRALGSMRPDLATQLRSLMMGRSFAAFLEACLGLESGALEGVSVETRCYAHGDYSMICDPEYVESRKSSKRSRIADTKKKHAKHAKRAAEDDDGEEEEEDGEEERDEEDNDEADEDEDEDGGRAASGGGHATSKKERWGHARVAARAPKSSAAAATVLDVRMGFQLVPEWDLEMGGYTVYLTTDEELLTMEAKANSLTIMVRPANVMSFVKYVNHRAPENRFEICAQYTFADGCDLAAFGKNDDEDDDEEDEEEGEEGEEEE